MASERWFFRWPVLALALAAITLIAESVTQGQPPGLLGESPVGDGVVGMTGAPDKSGVYGHSPAGVGVTGRSERGSGVVGWTGARGVPAVLGHSAIGRGVVGRSEADNGVIGWSGAPGRSGVFGHSERGLGVSGFSEQDDGVLAVSRSPNPGHAALRARNEGAGPALFVEGDLFLTGAVRGDRGPNGGAAFPQPSYVSQWTALDRQGVLVGLDAIKTFQHNLGGSPENYVVDLQFRTQGRLHHRLYGGDNPVRGATRDANQSNGVWWTDLTSQSISVVRGWSDDKVDEVRVRIWVYE